MHLLCVVAEWTLAYEHKIDATPCRPEIYALIVHLSPTEDLRGPIDMRADSRREHLQASCLFCILIRRRFLLHTAQIQRLHDLCCRSRFFIFIFFFFICVCLQLAGRLLADFLPDFALGQLLHLQVFSDGVPGEGALVELENPRVIEVDNLQLAVKDVFNQIITTPSCLRDLCASLLTLSRRLLRMGAPVEGLLGGAVGWRGFSLRQVWEVQEEVAGVKVTVHDAQRVHLMQCTEQLSHQWLRFRLSQARLA